MKTSWNRICIRALLIVPAFGFSVVVRTLRRDFHMPLLQRYRGWTCKPDFRGSRF